MLVLSAFLPISAQQGLRLDTGRVFNTLTLVALVSEPLQNLLQSLPQLTMALGCIGRIHAYLMASDHQDVATSISQSSLERTVGEKSSDPSPSGAYLVRDGHFAWTPDTPAVLRDLKIDIPAGKLTLVVGAVGSGKTSLLHALLGECIRVRGSITRPASSVAFCAQQPWLSNTAVRSAIVGHSDDDSAWYDVVVKACNLRPDIDSMSYGDETIVGSGGSTLSGGQKQRIVSDILITDFCPWLALARLTAFARLWHGESMLGNRCSSSTTSSVAWTCLLSRPSLMLCSDATVSFTLLSPTPQSC